MSSDETMSTQSCSCDFCQNVAGAILTSSEGAELHLHPSLFWDPQLGPLHIGVFCSIVLLAHEAGYRGLSIDKIMTDWEDKEVPPEDVMTAMEKLSELGFLVARNWIPQTHHIRWFLGSGLVIPHIPDQVCEICPTLPDFAH